MDPISASCSLPAPPHELPEHTRCEIRGGESWTVFRSDAPAQPGQGSHEPQRHGQTGMTDLDHSPPVLALGTRRRHRRSGIGTSNSSRKARQLRFECIPLQPPPHDLRKTEPIDAQRHLREFDEIVEMTQIDGAPPIIPFLDLVVHDQVQRLESR